MSKSGVKSAAVTDSSIPLPLEGGAEELKKAFELFTRETARLESAYSALREQFRQVNLELEETNSSLNAKVVELDTATRYLNSILSNMSQGLVFIDLSGQITTYNTAAEQFMGAPAKSVLFRSFTDSFTDNVFGFSISEALSSCEAPPTAYAQHRGLELEMSTTFALQGNTGTHGLIVMIKDITEVRRLQAMAQRHDRLKDLGEMAASVAHEIRNPLGGIRGFAALLARDLEKEPQLKQMADYIVSGTEALDSLVTNVLNYSRPVHLRPETICLVTFCHRMRELASADTALKNIHIAVEAVEEGISATVDPQQLQACLLNLVLNAAQAMEGTGQITLSISSDDRWALLSVSDTGCGIEAENLEKVFSPFFTTKADGNGFGLSEVHKIIEAHGGTIDVVSKVGVGTTFTCKLPTVKA